jgi:ribosomal protein S18 acetylase RimI-like enzyme
MSTVTLRPMTATELAERLPALIEGYADDIARAGRVPAESAREEAERQTTSLLPEGVDTRDALVLMAEDDGRPVGWIWLGLPGGTNGRDSAWVYNVEVDEGERGRGYGRAMMLAAEGELTRRGVSRLGLNVFADNAVARRLYESLGYQVTSQQMAKALG